MDPTMDILHANDYMMAQTHIRLFHRLFYKLSLFYATRVPRKARAIIDKAMMLQAVLCILLLLYVHTAFLASSSTCLDGYVGTWRRDGILRAQVQPPPPPANELNSDSEKTVPTHMLMDEQYVMEYSLHYSFLRMDDSLRKNLSIPVTNVTLDRDDVCFGNFLSRFLLEHLFGYDDILMSSFKKIAANVSNKGFLRNVVTGEHYRFIDMWLNKLNFLLSFVLMITLTSIISMLMRLCHHQLFKFFCKLLFALQNQVLYPVWMPFPIASIMTMFLALWGLETIMTELLDDPMVSFHLIAFVWMADNYYTICCHNYLSKKHFPRFFYLSNYLFYAFHNQYNGQFSGLALVATFLTTQFYMVYFYHKYELPVIEFFVSRTVNPTNPLNIEALITSLVQLQQNNYASLEPYNNSQFGHGQERPINARYGRLRDRWMMVYRYLSRYRPYLNRVPYLNRYARTRSTASGEEHEMRSGIRDLHDDESRPDHHPDDEVDSSEATSAAAVTAHDPTTSSSSLHSNDLGFLGNDSAFLSTVLSRSSSSLNILSATGGIHDGESGVRHRNVVTTDPASAILREEETELLEEPESPNG